MLYRTFKSPTNVQIELTTQCSNKCAHCYNFLCNTDSPDVTMSPKRLQQVMDELISAQVFGVTLTGGEPLLHPELVTEGIRLCEDGNIDCSINSNLTFLAEEDLLKMKEVGNFSILTSLASYSEQAHDNLAGRNGAFQDWVKSISLLNKHNISFAVNMVVTQHNAEHVYHTGLLAYSLGARSFSATKASPPAGCEDFSSIQPSKSQVIQSLDSLLRLHREVGIHVDALECYPRCLLRDLDKYAAFARRKCMAGILSATVSSSGDVRPCSHSDRVYGNIFDEGIVAVFSQMTEWRTGELIPATCKECKYFPQCSGGCRCEAEYVSSIDGMDPYASCPSDVERIRQQCCDSVSIEPETQILIPHDLDCRQEEFGFILRLKKQTLIVDTQAGEAIIKSVGKTITPNELAFEGGADISEAIIISRALVQQGLAELVHIRG